MASPFEEAEDKPKAPKATITTNTKDLIKLLISNFYFIYQE
jgi:hypothetical protein